MLEIQAAIYARVSSEQQAESHTVASQVAALRERLSADGLSLQTDQEFIDEGYSGASLLRPALERLRDRAAAGGIDRLYVHSPDRLARKYAYQVLLLEELRRAGVEVVFLNRELGRTPEDDLLLQVQGMVAEYERAKILERSRRGKRHAAKEGVVSVLSGAPYGYRYVTKQDGGGQARFEILFDEARVVRGVFEWVGRECLSISEVCRRLKQAGEMTPRGKTVWSRSTVSGLLRNQAYMGMAAYGKSQRGVLRPRLRAQRGRLLQPKQASSIYDLAAEEWFGIPVPAIVTKDLFEVVRAQLEENRQRARDGQRGARYLLQGLVVCALCGYAYYGKAISLKAAKGKVLDYGYYRCSGSDAYRFGGQRLCGNLQVRTDRLEEAVWRKVCALLEEPERLMEEYRRRLQNPARDRRGEDLATVKAQVRHIIQGIGRLIDSYAEGLIEKGDFEPRVRRLKERAGALEAQAHELANEAAFQSELRLLIGRLADFAATVRGGLDETDWNARRDIIRALIRRVEIDKGQVTVVFRVTPGPDLPGCNQPFTQDCTRGAPASSERGKSPQELMLSSNCGSWARAQLAHGLLGARRVSLD